MRFLTIGVGFAGNKNNVRPITDICFLITDGSRLEKDISTLVSVPTEQNPRACDLKTFKKWVSEHGLVKEALATSQQALHKATDRREQREQEREDLSAAFQKRKAETLQLLQRMQSSAYTEAHWLIASEQL